MEARAGIRQENEVRPVGRPEFVEEVENAFFFVVLGRLHDLLDAAKRGGLAGGGKVLPR